MKKNDKLVKDGGLCHILFLLILILESRIKPLCYSCYLINALYLNYSPLDPQNRVILIH